MSRVAGAIAMMKRVEDTKTGIARSFENLEHVGDALVGFHHSLESVPDLTTLRDEVVIGIDDQKRRYVFLVGHGCHGYSNFAVVRDPYGSESSDVPVSRPNFVRHSRSTRRSQGGPAG